MDQLMTMKSLVNIFPSAKSGDRIEGSRVVVGDGNECDVVPENIWRRRGRYKDVRATEARKPRL